ncbi:Hint domain-containing protein [Paracoccus sanguinis]|uniref:Hint domain-containing protein n=1 Tax=Paracoccus sanguinis TaxID=1545044 RepID=UPI001FD35CB3|nr:Hint domain-containing protein [Paracoccus sanguinis]
MPAISIVRLDESPFEFVNGLRADTVSRGVDLEGATITATYADGSVEILTWHATDPYTNGAAVGTDISMSYGFDWHHLATTKLLTSLQFDLQPAISAFDTVVSTDSAVSTPGSSSGYPFRLNPDGPDPDGTITVTYTGIVNLSGASAVGDLYTTMIIDFSGLSAGGLLGELSWQSDIDTMDPFCFAAGTRIATDRGQVAVEDLRAGDLVLTRDRGMQAIRWIGSRRLSAADLAARAQMRPIRIRRHALGTNIPSADLLVSPQHRVLVRSKIAQKMFGTPEILVAAKQLCEIDGIEVARDVTEVTYYHLMFDRHEVVISNGAETESLYTGPEALKTVGAAARREIFALFPELADRDHVPSPARVLVPGWMGRRLAARHVRNGKLLVN